MHEFEKELTSLINKHSLENASDTPDFIIAKYLVGCLHAFNHSAHDEATSDHAAIVDDVFTTTCDKRATWYAPEQE